MGRTVVEQCASYICRALRCVLLFRIAKLDTLFMVFLLSPLLGTLLTSSGMLPVAIFNAVGVPPCRGEGATRLRERGDKGGDVLHVSPLTAGLLSVYDSYLRPNLLYVDHSKLACCSCTGALPQYRNSSECCRPWQPYDFDGC